MSKRTYEEYIKNGCYPVGYNEPCQSYYFGQVSVDWLLDQIDQLKQQNEELMLQLSKYEIEKHKPAYCTLAGTECEYLGNVDELKQQLEESFTEEDVEGLIEDRDKTIKFLQKELAEKDKELAELKEKAIVPKYLLGQEVYTIYNGQIITGRIYEIQTNAVLHDKENLITYLVDFYSKYEDGEQDNDYFEEEDLFATEQEAQAKLKEIQGNE